MPRLTHIPQLSANDLEIAIRRIDQLAIPETAKRQLKAMLRTAANPQNEELETIIKTLPKARQDEIYAIFDEIAALHKQQNDDAAKALLLLGVLSLARLLTVYLLTVDQQKLQEAQLFNVMRQAWLNAIQDEINYVGGWQRAQGPNGADLAYLQQLAADDAASITATFNKDIEKHLQKLYKDYPNASAQFYIESMRAWAQDRADWKGLQIAFNTEARAREYARERFRQENYSIDTKYVFVGPPPTCEKCVTLFAAGVVDKMFIDQHPAPVHINCPHTWRAVRKPKVDLNNLWVG